MLVPLSPENPTVLQSCITGQYTSVGAIGAEADVAVTLSSVSGAGQVTGTYAKIISDVQGSVRVRVVPALPVLEFLFGDKAVDVIGSLRSLAVRIAEGIGGTGDYCDLGLDLAVSNSGQIFFFESNGRHDISIPYNVGDLDIWVAAVRTPMEYCYTRLIS